MSFNTGNPVPSSDGRDLSDNAATLDLLVNDTLETATTRTGEQVLTRRGLEVQYIQTAINGGIWAAGQTFTAFNQYMVFGSTAYKPKSSATLPYVVGATPVGDSNIEVVDTGTKVLTRLNPDTLAIWQTDTSAQGDDIVTTKERSTGKGGGATGDVIAGTGTADGYSIVAHNTLSLSWVLRVDVEVDIASIGATGYGVSVDTGAVQAAINLGVNVDFRDDLTLLVSGLSWSKSNVTYRGRSSFKLVDAAAGSISTMAANANYVTFIGLDFDGNGVSQTGGIEANNGVVLSDNHIGLRFRGCSFHDFGAPTNQPDNPNVGSDYNKSDGIVSFNSGAGDISDTEIEDCTFENCYVGIAIRAAGEVIRVISCSFKHHSDNSIKTRVGMKNIVVTNCTDEDTRGAECWGEFLRYTDNYSLNSHRHGVSGGLKGCYISGNTFEHETVGLESLYAIEIGLSLDCRVKGNRILSWNGTAAIRMTDTEQLSKNTIVEGNTVIGGIFTASAIGSSNAQDGCVYSGNVLIDIGGIAIAPRGFNNVISNNIVKDNSADLLNSITTVCLNIPVGGQSVVTGNSFSLAGKWLTGDPFLSVILGSFDDSIFEGNYIFGGRNSINGGLSNSIIQGNIFKDVAKLLNTDSGSEGAIFRDNIQVNVTTLKDSGDYDGFATLTSRMLSDIAAPTAGAWLRGDRVIYTDSTAGGKVGSVCVSSGSPGTWKEYGAIDA